MKIKKESTLEVLKPSMRDRSLIKAFLSNLMSGFTYGS
jgi:hypothetical protein